MTALAFALAAVGLLLGGGAVVANGRMTGPDAVVFTTGLVALYLGVRRLQESAARRGPWPDGYLFARHHVDVTPDGAGFAVRYGHDLGPTARHPAAPTAAALDVEGELAAAVRATPGAAAAAAAFVGLESVTGLHEDAVAVYERRLRATPANVLALRATRLVWSRAARRLAAALASPDGAEPGV